MGTMMMLLRRGDLNLNCSAQAYEDSIKEGVRQAMLRHDAVFRSQVRELHRLYWTQKNLMHEICWKGSDVYTGISSRKTAADEFDMESNSLMVNSTEAKKNGVSRELLSDSSEVGRQTKRGFDLSIPADDFIIDSGDEIDEVLEVKPYLCDDSKVGLVRGESYTKQGNGQHVGFSLSDRSVIDLEKPVMRTCSADGETSDSQLAVTSNIDSINRSGKNSLVISLEDHSNADASEPQREKKWHHFSVGSNECSGSLANLNTQKQKTTPCKLYQIDLNISQDDESIQVLPNPVALFHSPSASSSVVHHGNFWRDSSIIYPKEYDSKNRCSKDSSVSDLAGQAISAQGISKVRIADVLCHGHEDSHLFSSRASTSNTQARKSVWNQDQPMVDTKFHGSGPEHLQECYRHSLEGSSSGSNGGGHSSSGFHKSVHGNVGSLPGELHYTILSENQMQPSSVISSDNINAEHNKHASVGSSNLPITVVSALDEKKADRGGSEEDTVSSHAIAEGERQPDEFSGEYPVGSKPDRMAGSTECTSSLDPSAVKDVFLPISMHSGLNQLHDVDIPEASDRAGTPSKLSNMDDIEQLQAQRAEMDHIIARAAETLVCISSEKSTCFTDNLGRKRQTVGEGGNDQPEYSSDSFERGTLNLQETTDDGLWIPATPAEKETRKDTCGIKLRRGRGLRDFQKEILPGLVSLARHEICDDLHTIGYELRKNRPRRTCRENPSVRTRRSSLYSTGKRS
ncbi:uncharacterized protein [Typha latifolia]|uniref:uncharacterized protein n=1 Tax=Typha latifolia TaxID=4733 RepID=UPI003C2EF055